MTKFLNFFFLVSFVTLNLVSYSSALAKQDPIPQISAEKNLKECSVALILNKGGRDDKSFNASAYEGLMRLSKEPGFVVKYVEPTEGDLFETRLTTFANSPNRKFDVIISVSVAQVEAVGKIAKKFPEQKFVIIDGEVKGLPNVRSVVFKEHEGSFLVGFIAGKVTKTAKLGFIGGMDIPLIRRFEYGFVAGAKHARPGVEVISKYVGTTPVAWNNPAHGKELAISQMNEGVDIIFAAAGASGNGVFDAVEEMSTEKKPKFAIGVDSNQNGEMPGRILTSMLKEVGSAVYSSAWDVRNGKFTAGTMQMGFESGGVGYALDSHNKKLLSPELLKAVEKIRSEIIQGKIEVPDYYKLEVKK